MCCEKEILECNRFPFSVFLFTLPICTVPVANQKIPLLWIHALQKMVVPCVVVANA